MIHEVIEFEEGWNCIQQGITKLKNWMEGLPKHQLSSKEFRLQKPFTSEEYSVLYTTIYNMCTQKHPYDHQRQLYHRYKKVFEDYVNSKVLPTMKGKHDQEFMLKELVKRWDNYKTMIECMSVIFNYLDRYFVHREQFPSLREVGLMTFRDLMYSVIKDSVRNAVIAMVDDEREGKQIDQALLKNILDMFVGIGMGRMDAYETDFEAFLLQDSVDYYKRKAASWIEEDSYANYMLKAEECLKKEKERVGHYLHFSSEVKLLEKVEYELFTEYKAQLLEKEHSEYVFCSACASQ